MLGVGFMGIRVDIEGGRKLMGVVGMVFLGCCCFILWWFSWFESEINIIWVGSLCVC